tara:strand:+ start:718 stop:1308 length:591 start_codon:yes stop_codon:yes gene_type:complete
MKSTVFEILETLAFALVVLFLMQTAVANYKVDLYSMDETLKPGDRLVVNRLLYAHVSENRFIDAVSFWQDGEQDGSSFLFHTPRRGEIIVFKFPMDISKDYVKRIIGLPGELIAIKRGQVLVDGEPLTEPYVVHNDRSNMNPILVPEDTYFVLGDNRDVSSDSRNWGVVPLDNIVGKVWLRYWPGSEIILFSGQEY